MSTDGNMRLWSQLKAVDRRVLKDFQRPGGFRGTNIDATWRMMRMTELFGPVGQGWGWEQVGEPVIAEGCVFICVQVWYRDEDAIRHQVMGEPIKDKFWTGPQWGGTELLIKNRDGSTRHNDEAFKMSMTDALGKCLVSLGLGADVYLNSFAGERWTREGAAEEAQELVRARPAVAATQSRPERPPRPTGPQSPSNGHAEPKTPGSAFVPGEKIQLRDARNTPAQTVETPFFGLKWVEDQLIAAPDSKAVRALFINNADFLKACRDGADEKVQSRYCDVQEAYQDRLRALEGPRS